MIPKGSEVNINHNFFYNTDNPSSDIEKVSAPGAQVRLVKQDGLGPDHKRSDRSGSGVETSS